MQCGWMDVYLRAISLLKHCGNLHYVSLYKPSLNVLMMKIAFMFDFVGVQGNQDKVWSGFQVLHLNFTETLDMQSKQMLMQAHH